MVAEMSVIITGGQSYSEIAARFTLDPAYGPAIQNYNNMQGQDITGKKFYLKIPDTWMKPEYAGKQIQLTSVSGGMAISPWVWAGLALLVVMTR